jgi:hypothetical protein
MCSWTGVCWFGYFQTHVHWQDKNREELKCATLRDSDGNSCSKNFRSNCEIYEGILI